jgi:hypothetical protein
MKFVGDPGPEFLGLLNRFAIEVLVFFERLNVGLFGKMRRTFELSIFLENRINVGLSRKNCFLCHGNLTGGLV